MLLLALGAPGVSGQELKLAEAMRQAMELYPSIRVNEEQVRAAAAGVRQARLAYLPNADAIAQVNRATRNNVYGMLLQQQVISPISGPPLAANAGTNVWGTATGFLVSWEPFDFGLRRANTSVSEVTRERAAASLERTRFEMAALVADAFLTVIAAEESLVAAQGVVDRIGKLLPAVGALVDSGLRPGLDRSRLEAEQAQAASGVAQAEAAVVMARASLAQFLAGTPPGGLRLQRGRLLEAVSVESGAAVKTHPAMMELQLAQKESLARMRVIERSFYPRFNAQATLYARGTGANADFTTGGAWSGLGPNIYNWGLGFTMTYSLMDLPGLRIRKEIEAARGRAEQSRQEQLRRELEAQKNRALAQFEAAKRVSGNTPTQWKAAGEARAQAEARYRAGLSSISEVADAERSLLQAEVDDRLARLGIWRARLAVAVAEGDLTDFLARVEGPIP
ncbi:MAG: TolC family protein [Acidobacteriota bacterium]